jgi:hypothetical protein
MTFKRILMIIVSTLIFFIGTYILATLMVCYEGYGFNNEPEPAPKTQTMVVPYPTDHGYDHIKLDDGLWLGKPGYQPVPLPPGCILSVPKGPMPENKKEQS